VSPKRCKLSPGEEKNKTFDVSYLACKEFGFFCGDRVKTPKGNAWVVGVHSGDLYFQLDGDNGASKWSGFNKETFSRRGFSLLFRPTQNVNKTDKPEYTASSLLSLVNNQEFSDVCFVLDDGEKFYAMKGILVTRSPYFQALFTNKTEEKEAKEVIIHGVDRPSFAAIITYLYTGSVEISKENCVPLLKAADLFLVDDIKLMCAQELTSQVTTDTVLDTLFLAEQRNLTKLKKFCIKFLVDHLQEPTLHASFKQNFICKQTNELIMEVIDYLLKKQNDMIKQRKSKKRRREGGLHGE